MRYAFPVPYVLNSLSIYSSYFKYTNNTKWRVQTETLIVLYLFPFVGNFATLRSKYEGVSKSFRTSRLERELQMIQLSATRCSCIAILCDNPVRFAAITVCVASEQVFIFLSVHFVMTQSGNFWIQLHISSVLCPHPKFVFFLYSDRNISQLWKGTDKIKIRRSFRGGKLPGCEADHSPPSSAEVKNAWSYTSTPPVLLHDVVLSL
jgi:hypothetical protein